MYFLMFLSLITFIIKISEKEETSGKEEEVAKDGNDEKEKNNSEEDGLPSWSKIISDAEKARNKKDQISNKRGNNDDDISQLAIDMSVMTLKSRL